MRRSNFDLFINYICLNVWARNLVEFQKVSLKFHPKISHPNLERLRNQGTLWFNSQWPSDAIKCHGTWYTLNRVIACCLTAPSHYLNQSWLIINEVLCHSCDLNFTRNAQDIYPWYEIENNWFNITTTYARGQRVKNSQVFLTWSPVSR